jgi:hypothetical protein
MGAQEDATAMAQLATHGMTIRDIDGAGFVARAEQLWDREARALGVESWLRTIRT